MRHFSTFVCLTGVLILAGCSRGPEPPTAQPSPRTDPPPAVAETRPELNLDERGRALRGYDPVAYFTEGRAVPGDTDIRETWEGAEYFFTTEGHRETFVLQPEIYLPAHGGYCTFGIVLEKKFDGDPEVWLIRNDQLHVFLNQDVQGKFMSDEEANLARVEANWPQIRDKTTTELGEGAGGGGDDS